MSVQGATPFSATSRTVGATTVPVRSVRTQSLQPGMRVLLYQRKCTVLDVQKNASDPGWRISLQLPDSSTKTLTKPAGFIWAVLDN